MPESSRVLNNAISEVQGVFASDAALQDAIGRLTLAGFDRADLSLPADSPPSSSATPDAGAAAPSTETDTRQMRTLLSSTAGVSGAMIAAAATMATGGAAGIAIAAAAAGGLALGGGTAAVTSAVGDSQKEAREAAAAEGKLVLAVNTPTEADAARAERALHEAGAVKVARVRREGAAVVHAA